ncbi:MAG TPA: PHP domain-containing protein [Actinopolymorphaceae bacterium]
MLPVDNHTHSEWSWDARPDSSMERSCERAVAVGVPAIAFTEHVDFTDWGEGDLVPEDGAELVGRTRVKPFDVEGYHESVQRCRERFPELRILTGIETGEPHLFAGGLSGLLKVASFDRVLGSLHSINLDGRIMGPATALSYLRPEEMVRRCFEEVVRLVEGSAVFEVLAHVDFARRYWPSSAGPYDEGAFEEEYRAIFRALAATDRVLEINTSSPLASVRLVRWWYEAGGRAVSFGSDAHVPDRVGDRFELAVDVVENAGFKPGRDRYDFWRR